MHQISFPDNFENEVVVFCPECKCHQTVTNIKYNLDDWEEVELACGHKVSNQDKLAEETVVQNSHKFFRKGRIK